ncbi:tetratricopeptide repeat protein [Algibacillus agarilyticus]|uniref:tetratricopeptide repeat protein n=1 Tax=Algibacillus agarilyticus TaxID=2234133 RepID=UPI000DD0EAC8|nr:tetratricopeptide repeat protein [Algibacillus agarilyticus]
MNRVWIFRLIAIAIPFLFFAMLEGGLRLANYGRDVTLFIENPQAPEFLLPRPDVVKRYFAEGVETPNVTIEANFFSKQKSDDALRLVVQGGSTAAGFPFGIGASIAGMLDYRLKQTFPDRDVEVISTALSAVNSYTVLDFADEIIAQQPDAVLIYAGHNEYLGILGVGSAYTAANSQAATLMYLKLKNLKIFQLLQNTYAHYKGQTKPSHNQTSRTFMSKVAKHKNIPLNSALYEQGLTQFETNMQLLLKKYQAANIPVFISTIASNLADQKPFSSAALNKQGQVWLTKLRNYTLLTHDELEQAQTVARQQQSADLFYALGQITYAKSQYPQAKTYFEQARDHDLLRFRAPTAINEQIKQLTKQPNVTLVDAEQALTKQAINGIIGRKLMLEHLHPTIDGYFYIADSFYQSLQQSPVIDDFPTPISTAQAKADLPIFEAEIYWGKAKVAGLMADYPFTDKPHSPKLPPQLTWQDQLGYKAYKKQLGWIQIAQETAKRSQKSDPITFNKALKLLADAVPNDSNYNYQAGTQLIQARRASEALRYLKRAVEQKPKEPNYRLALAHAYAMQQRFKESLHWLNSVLKIDKHNKMALSAIAQVNQAMNQ